MFTRRTFTGLAIIATADAGLAPASAAQGSRRAEVQTLRHFAEATHPEGARAAQDPTWRALAHNLERRANTMDEATYVVETLRLLSWFRDGHTGVYIPALQSGAWSLRLPLGREVFYDGVYITRAKEEALPLLGGRVTHVGGVAIEGVIRRFAEIWPASSAAGAHYWAILLLSSPGFLHGLGIVNGPADTPITIDCVMPDGAAVSAAVRPRADGARDRQALAHEQSELARFAATQNYDPQAHPAEDGRNFVWQRGNVLYVSLDRMSDDDYGKPFPVFQEELCTALGHSGADRLIIDLRRNGGGDNMLCEPARRRIAHSTFNSPGGLYVLIAPHTFSAAQNLANRLERETFAIFVGEPSGGAPNHFGDARHFTERDDATPASVSTVRWMDSSPFDQRRWLMPDVLAPATFADFVSGRDAAFEAALTHRDDRAADETLLTTPWERASQAQSWRPFWT